MSLKHSIIVKSPYQLLAKSLARAKKMEARSIIRAEDISRHNLYTVLDHLSINAVHYTLLICGGFSKWIVYFVGL